MNAILSRRSFVAGLSRGGRPRRRRRVARASPPALPLGARAVGPGALQSTPDEVNAFVVVDPDDAILLRIAKSEMGQGVMTSLAMIVAEELECDFAKVKVEYASATATSATASVYGPMMTGGSSSVRRSRVMLQQAGASARARLIAAAARALGRCARAPASRASGAVWHDASRRARRLRRGRRPRPPAYRACAQEPAIKTPDQYKLIGTAASAAGYAGQGHRRGQVRHRHAPARHGLRRGRQLPGVRRQG